MLALVSTLSFFHFKRSLQVRVAGDGLGIMRGSSGGCLALSVEAFLPVNMGMALAFAVWGWARTLSLACVPGTPIITDRIRMLELLSLRLCIERSDIARFVCSFYLQLGCTVTLR